MKPDGVRDILGVIGQIQCINVARIGQPEQLRYFGKGKGCSGQAHDTQAKACADVQAWHAGKPVVYEQHAVVPLGPVVKKPVADGSFVIGEGNTWAQAWEALVGGHQVKRPYWPSTKSMILRTVGPDGFLHTEDRLELTIVSSYDPVNWHKSRAFTEIGGAELAATDWIVLPKIHPEPITV